MATTMELKFCKARGINVLVALEDVEGSNGQEPGIRRVCLNREKECAATDHCELCDADFNNF